MGKRKLKKPLKTSSKIAAKTTMKTEEKLEKKGGGVHPEYESRTASRTQHLTSFFGIYATSFQLLPFYLPVHSCETFPVLDSRRISSAAGHSVHPGPSRVIISCSSSSSREEIASISCPLFGTKHSETFVLRVTQLTTNKKKHSARDHLNISWSPACRYFKYLLVSEHSYADFVTDSAERFPL